MTRSASGGTSWSAQAENTAELVPPMPLLANTWSLQAEGQKGQNVAGGTQDSCLHDSMWQERLTGEGMMR